MKTIKEFVAQIISGDNIGARETFQSLVAEKSMEALAERKQEIAQTLFQTEDTNLDEEETYHVINKKSRMPGTVSSRAGQNIAGVTIKDKYHDRKEAAAHAKHLDKYGSSEGHEVSTWVDGKLQEGVEIEEGNAANKEKKNLHFDKMGANWKKLNPQHDFPQNARALGRGVNAYGNEKQVKAAQQAEEFEQVDEVSSFMAGKAHDIAASQQLAAWQNNNKPEEEKRRRQSNKFGGYAARKLENLKNKTGVSDKVIRSLKDIAQSAARTSPSYIKQEEFEQVDEESLDEISQKLISSYLTKKLKRMDKEIESVPQAKRQQAFGANGQPIKGKTVVDPADKAKETRQIKKIKSNYDSDRSPAVDRRNAFNAGRGDKWWEKKPESEFKGASKLYHKKGAEYGEAEREEKKQHKANMTALRKKYTEEFEQVDEENTRLKTSDVASLYRHKNGDHFIVRNRDGKQIHYGTEGSATKLWNQLYAKDVKKDVKEDFEQVDESGGIKRAMKQLKYASKNSTKDNDPAIVHAANKAYHKYNDSKLRARHSGMNDEDESK